MASKVLEVKGGDKLAKVLAHYFVGGGVKVGFLENATYPGTDDKPGLPVATVAFWNEFGTVKAPPRPFFRNAIAKNSPEWGELVAGLIRGTAGRGNGITEDKLWGTVGTVIKDQIVQSIVDTNSPPLAPSTVKRKGFAKPLVDTGVMQRSVDYVVTGKKP